MRGITTSSTRSCPTRSPSSWVSAGQNDFSAHSHRKVLIPEPVLVQCEPRTFIRPISMLKLPKATGTLRDRNQFLLCDRNPQILSQVAAGSHHCEHITSPRVPPHETHGLVPGSAAPWTSLRTSCKCSFAGKHTTHFNTHLFTRTTPRKRNAKIESKSTCVS